MEATIVSGIRWAGLAGNLFFIIGLIFEPAETLFNSGLPHPLGLIN